MRWVLDRYLLDRAHRTGHPTLAEAALEAGHEVHITGRENGIIPDINSIPFDESQPVVTYGSHQFVAAIERTHGRRWTPCAYHRLDGLSCAATMAHLGDVLLNDDLVLLPYAVLKRRRTTPWGGAIFLRPNAVTKAFTGMVVTEEEFDHEIATLDQTAHLDPEFLVAVARPKTILGEFRFVIVNGEVVTGSEYSWGGKLDIRIDVHPAAETLANEVAKRRWQPDIAYACDVCITERDGQEVPRVVELNAMSCSGLYACDTRRIVKAIAEAAWAEFKGDLP